MAVEYLGVQRIMHLLVLAEEFYPETSGGAHVRWRFCQLAVERGHEITVFTPHKEGLAKSETVDGVEIRRPFLVKPDSVSVYSPIAVVTRIAASVLFFAYLCWWLRDRDVDGLHSASHLTHWVGKALSVLYSLPLVTFIGYTPSVDGDPSLSPQLLLERINFRFFMGGTVFCRTPRTKDTVEQYTNGEIAILHGILNRKRIESAIARMRPEQRRADIGVRKDGILLVYVGRLVPIKNPVGAIEVLSELPSKYQLAVVGDGDEREAMERAARKYMVEDQIHFYNTLPHIETLETIAVADALLLPSHQEAYPTVVFEALSLNTAAFVTPVGIIPTIDHPLLHVNPTSELAETVCQTEVNTSGNFDPETLEYFSMERYTEDLLNALEK